MTTEPARLQSLGRTTLLAIALGGCSFGLAHLLIAWFNGLSASDWPLTLLGLAAGFALAAVVMIVQAETMERVRYRRWVASAGLAALAFAVIQGIFVLTDGWGSGLAISLTSSYYDSQLSGRVDRWWPDLARAVPQWPDLLALLDAALVGVVLAIGVTIGHAVASRGLRRWHTLVEQPH